MKLKHALVAAEVDTATHLYPIALMTVHDSRTHERATSPYTT